MEVSDRISAINIYDVNIYVVCGFVFHSCTTNDLLCSLPLQLVDAINREESKSVFLLFWLGRGFGLL